MATLHLKSGCSEFVEDSCIVCKSTCMKKIIGTDGQISSKDLFSLLDTPNKGINKTYYLSTCNTCSKKIGKLQGLYDTLMQIQQSFKELQVELASKIVSCCPSEEVEQEEDEDDDEIRVLPSDNNNTHSIAAQDTLYNICKRWRRELNENEIRIGPNTSESTLRSLMGITTKIPEGLIIRPSPAPPTTPSVGTSSSSSHTTSQNHHQFEHQQQQVEVVHQEGIEISSPIRNNTDNNNTNTNENAPLPPPVQFHLDLNDFDEILDEGVEDDEEEEEENADDDDDTQASEYPINDNDNFNQNDNPIDSNNSKVIDYVNLQDEDSSSDDDDFDRGDVNADDLIPTVELSTYSSSDQNTSLDQQDIFPGTSIVQSNTSASITRNLSIETQINPDIEVSPTRSPYFDPNDDGFDDTMLSTGMLPVGQAAVSPGCEPRNSRTRKTRNATSNQVKSKTLHPPRPNQPLKSQIFRCTQCPKLYKSREEFKEHLNNHKNLAPTCPICQKVFPRRHNLIIHMRIHSGETPYCCPVCSQRYSDRSNYNAHVRKHLDRPFGCLICRKMFKTSHEAQSHAQAMHPNNSDKNIISKVTYKRKPT